MLCPCGTGENYTECCEPYLEGREKPQTARQLMRSRYTAFTQHHMDYILETHDPKTRNEVDMKGNTSWAKRVQWQSLEILSVEGGEATDSEGWVEFKAHYLENEKPLQHHEQAHFRKRKGTWYYVDGRVLGVETYQREQRKIGRNEPCPCGSGKKYKKCCAA